MNAFQRGSNGGEREREKGGDNQDGRLKTLLRNYLDKKTKNPGLKLGGKGAN